MEPKEQEKQSWTLGLTGKAWPANRLQPSQQHVGQRWTRRLSELAGSGREGYPLNRSFPGRHPKTGVTCAGKES